MPSEVGNFKQLDLRLLSGDLGNPDESTSVVKQLMKIYENTDTAGFVDVLLLLSGSGFGKTKSILDVAAKRYVIFFDGSGNAQMDIKNMLSRVQTYLSKVKRYCFF